MKTIKYWTVIMIGCIATACSNKSDPAADKANFTRIYDNSGFNTSYYPIDVIQTPDGGYLILGGRKLEQPGPDGTIEVSNFSGIYLLKTDEFGGYISDQEVDSINVDPIGPILTDNGSYYFFSMTGDALQSQMMQIDATGAIQQTIRVGGTYPLAAGSADGNFLLLSYDNDKKESVVSVVNPNGSVSASNGYSIGAGDAVEEPIIDYFTRTGRQFPFQVGKAPSGKYFFNGFYNYTFSLLFTDLSDAKPDQVQGTGDDAGLNQIVSLGGNNYATSRFDFGENYILPAAVLDNSALSSGVELGGNTFPELVKDAPVKTMLTKINSQGVILYASNTLSRQIALYAYNQTTGKFMGSKYIGFSNPYEIASMISTADGGLAVLGTTYVAGRFSRICLFKYSADELAKSFH